VTGRSRWHFDWLRVRDLAEEPVGASVDLGIRERTRLERGPEGRNYRPGNDEPRTTARAVTVRVRSL